MKIEPTYEYHHTSVLSRDVCDFVLKNKPKVIVDATLGGGGHTLALLELLPDIHIIGIDRDKEAIQESYKRLNIHKKRITLIHDRFGNIENILKSINIKGVDAILVDLGVSSYQLDNQERGFSFRFDAPLDMRMDQKSGKTALDIIQTTSVKELTNIIYTFGEERFARKIALAINNKHPTSTIELADTIRSTIPFYKSRIDPATKTFQALRIYVNQEIQELNAWLNALKNILNKEGIALAISFHSLEDRAVKRAFKKGVLKCICEPNLPICSCKHTPFLEILTSKPITANDDEIKNNPRSRSAKLRVAKRL